MSLKKKELSHSKRLKQNKSGNDKVFVTFFYRKNRHKEVICEKTFCVNNVNAGGSILCIGSSRRQNR